MTNTEKISQAFLHGFLETAGVSEIDELQVTMFVCTASSRILWRRHTDPVLMRAASEYQIDDLSRKMLAL
jgi:hypothetical protein